MTKLHVFALLRDPGRRVPSDLARRRHELLQREGGPDFLTPRSDALGLANARGRVHSVLAPPASEVADPSRAYLALLDGPENTPRVAVAVREASARPDAPNAPSIALLAASRQEGVAA